MTLNELFKNTTYDDTLFSAEAKSAIESRIFMKPVRGTEVPYITCAIRNKDIKLTPEEAVRQLYIYMLMNNYGYMASRIQLETPIHFGREVKRADIAIMDKDRPMVPYIIVELKKPKLTDGKEQLKSYCNATGAPIGVWTNGEQISCYNRKDPNFFEEISDVKPFLLQDTSPRYMADSDFFRLKKYALSSNDILVSVVGTLGNACIIQNHEIPAIFSCKSTAIKSTGINPFYLLCYLNSKYGNSYRYHYVYG